MLLLHHTSGKKSIHSRIIQRTSFWLVNFLKTDCLSYIHSIYNIGSKIDINCLIKDLKLCIFNTLNNFTQLKRGPLLKDKTNQIPRDFYTILTTHNAFRFTISPKYLWSRIGIHDLTESFLIYRLINQIIFCNDWFLIAVLVPKLLQVLPFHNLKRYRNSKLLYKYFDPIVLEV